MKRPIDESPRIGAVPLSCTVDFFNDAAVGIDEYGQRQLRCAQHVLHLQSSVDEMADRRIGIS